MLKKSIFIILLCIGFVSMCGTRNGAQGQQSDSNDFTLSSLEGREYTLSAYKGNVVLVDFWATWCPPCRTSIPALISLYDKYHDQGFVVLGISNEDHATLTAFRDEYKVNYPILIDDQKVMQSYGVQSIPNMYIFNKQGKVAKHQVGFSPEMEALFDSFIDSLLAE